MKTIQYTHIDKSDWGEGPWQSEPDKVQWSDPDTGMPCLAVRHDTAGHWCGYVGVTRKHPWFEVEYDNVRVADSDDEYPNVHGGLTFSRFCMEGPDHSTVCHLPGDDEPDEIWWLGFDCAHAGDYSPGINAIIARGFRERGLELPDCFRRDDHETYRTLDFVGEECTRLAALAVLEMEKD